MAASVPHGWLRDAMRVLCPICNNVSDGTYLVLTEETTATGT